MARNEADREDLMAELVTASPRWELRVAELPDPVVLGVRSDHRLSIYFHGDRCYHFTGQGELRRAYVNGALYRSAGTTLSRLIRHRTAEETALMRHDLDSDELQAFLQEMRDWLTQLQSGLNRGQAEVLRGYPEPPPDPVMLAPLLELIRQTESPLSPPLK